MFAFQRRDRATATHTAAQLHHGVLSRTQLQALGWTPDALRHAVAQGRLTRLTEQVYAVGLDRSLVTEPDLSLHGSRGLGTEPRLSLHGWRTAALLAAGGGAALAGAWAGQLHGLRGTPELPVEVVIPTERLPPAASFVTARRRIGLDVVRRNGFLCLSVEDLVLDQASAATDLRDVVGILTDALGRGLTTTRRLTVCADARPRLRRRREIAAVLRDVAAGMASLLEVRYGVIERRHRLPPARRQAVASRDGRTTRADGLIDACKVLIELDGRQGHQGEGAFRDRWRDNWGVRHGYATLRYGYQELFGAPCAVAAEVVTVCLDRGWTGRPRACRPGCDVTRWER